MAEHESKHTKQKDKTKAYWDTFYSTLPSSADDATSFATKGDLAQKTKAKEDTAKKEDTSDLEWIVPNSPGLLDTILSLFPLPTSETTDRDDARNDSSAINVLEIGCGVSQLSISLLRRVLLKKKESASELLEHPPHAFVATDVSPVCIEHNITRDGTFISTLLPKNDGSLRYEFLDVLNEQVLASSSIRKYNVILDKGTLDTFLFRSKRTKKGSSIHPPLLTPLLNNIHRWLLPGCGSKYIIISPRSKIKSVRDFKGFASVRRTKVDTATLDGNDVVLVKSNNKEAARSKSEVYLYECIKNDKYKPDVDEPYSSMGCNSNSDDETCGKCGLSFKEFRGNVDVLDQGEAVWARRWKNHCAHCKEK